MLIRVVLLVITMLAALVVFAHPDETAPAATVSVSVVVHPDDGYDWHG